MNCEVNRILIGADREYQINVDIIGFTYYSDSRFIFQSKATTAKIMFYAKYFWSGHQKGV
jgi:hypothetical protein